MTDRTGRAAHLFRRHWVEVGWWLFVLVNAAGILVFSEWATVPFHFIWIGLSLIYGWRVWGLRATGVTLAAVVVITGVALLDDVMAGDQAADELTEIPLMSAVFVAMVWYVRRSVATQKEIERISEHNLALLHQGRQFVQEASHMLRTPLTIALGHAEVLRRTTVDAVAAEDSKVVIDELNRLKKITDRLLALATSEQPDFVRPVQTSVRPLVTRAFSRWERTCPTVHLGRVDDVLAPLDPDRILEALDELLGNAVGHSPPGTSVEVSARREGGWLVLSVTDSGPGIPDGDQALIFDRWARLPGSHRSGVGLGLAIVKAIADAHGGSVGVRSREGSGTTFELRLPLTAAHRAVALPDMPPQEEAVR